MSDTISAKPNFDSVSDGSTPDYDVIVVGAGNAALAAAVSAKENGAARVLVLEKAPPEMRGGNTHWSGGALRFSYDDPRELGKLVPHLGEGDVNNFYAGLTKYPDARYLADLNEVTEGRTDPELSRILVSQSKSTVFWMNDMGGIPMEPAYQSGLKRGDILAWAPGYAIRAQHEGAGLSRAWFATIERLGIELRYSSAAVDLLQDKQGAVSGVKIRDNEGLKDVTAKAVILGCGGFEANVQMRTQYIPVMGQAKVRGTPHNQGDGLRMALAIGAMPWGQWNGCHATPISADWGDFAPREMTDRSNRLSYTYSVMLNRKGRRFVNEGENLRSYTYAKFGREVLAQPGGKAWQIFDSKVLHLLEARYSTSKPIVSDTLEGLIAQLDIDDQKQALETVLEFNRAACDPAEGFDSSVRDGLSTKGLDLEKTNWALRIDKPPFHAYSVTGGITFTFGGLKVDRNAQVIGTDWRPIKGLYACGEMIGGLFYDNYPAGTGLVSGATFGRIAGASAMGKRVAEIETAAEVAPSAQTNFGSAEPAHSDAGSAGGSQEDWVP